MMRPDHKRSLSVFLFALPIVTALMVMIFGTDADPWTIWLYKWSSLIAGLLAVAAAIQTVRQMQKSDLMQQDRFERSEAQQQKRHEDLIKLSLRPDRLKAERAAEKAGDLEEMCSMFPDWTYPASQDKRVLRRAVLDYLNDVKGCLQTTDEELNSEVLKEASVLFDAGLFQSRDTIKYFRGILNATVSAAWETSQTDDAVVLAMEECAVVEDRIVDFIGELRIFSEGVQALRDQYV